jgi:hypothetical protein
MGKTPWCEQQWWDSIVPAADGSVQRDHPGREADLEQPEVAPQVGAFPLVPCLLARNFLIAFLVRFRPTFK